MLHHFVCLGAAVSLPIEAKKYMRNLVEQSIVQFFVAVKVRETRQLYLKVIIMVSDALMCDALMCNALMCAGGAFATDIASTSCALSSCGHSRANIQSKDIIHKHSSSFTV